MLNPEASLNLEPSHPVQPPSFEKSMLQGANLVLPGLVENSSFSLSSPFMIILILYFEFEDAEAEASEVYGSPSSLPLVFRAVGSLERSRKLPQVCEPESFPNLNATLNTLRSSDS